MYKFQKQQVILKSHKKMITKQTLKYTLSLLVCLVCSVSMSADPSFTLTYSGGSTKNFTSLQACFEAMASNSYSHDNGVFKITANTSWSQAGTDMSSTLSKYGKAVGVDLRGKTGLTKVIIDGGGHTINHTDYSGKHYEVFKTLNIVVWLPANGVLEVRNLKINDNICFKPWGDVYGGPTDIPTEATTPNTDIYFEDCIITGHYTSGRVPFRQCTFNHCRTEYDGEPHDGSTTGSVIAENCLIWPKVNYSEGGKGSGTDYFMTPYKIVLTNNYAKTLGWVNTASVNYNTTNSTHYRVKVDIVAHHNIAYLPNNNKSMCLVQNTDCFGNIDIHDNYIIGDYIKNEQASGDNPQCILYQYLHNTNYYEKMDGFKIDGHDSFMYDKDCSIKVYNNYMQCGIAPFCTGGEDKVKIYTYDEIASGTAKTEGGTPLSTFYNFVDMTGNQEVHHFATMKNPHVDTDKCHFCPRCGLAVVTADHDGCVMANGVDINSIQSTIDYAWNDIKDINWNGNEQTFDIKTNYALNGVKMSPNESKTFTFNSDDGSARNGAKKVREATFLGTNITSQIASSYTWKNNTALTTCPVFKVTPKVKLIISGAGYTTFSSDENVSFENPEKVGTTGSFTAYRATKYTPSTGRLDFTSTTELPSDEGSFVKGDQGTYWLNILENASRGTNGMIKGGKDVSVSSLQTNCFVLARSNSNPLGFYRVSSSANIPFGNAYLDVSGISEGPASSKDMNIASMVFDDEATGVIETEMDSDDDAVSYTITSMQASKNYRGIVIRNGKKIFKK